jgi:hypothetical protein
MQTRRLNTAQAIVGIALAASAMAAPSKTLTWNYASGNNTWDTTSLNFTDGVGNVAFQTGDTVIFVTITNNIPVAAGGVAPGAVFWKATSSRTLTGGGGGITSGSFTFDTPSLTTTLTPPTVMSYSGETLIRRGVLNLSAANNISNSSQIILNGGTLVLNSATATINAAIPIYVYGGPSETTPNKSLTLASSSVGTKTVGAFNVQSGNGRLEMGTSGVKSLTLASLNRDANLKGALILTGDLGTDRKLFVDTNPSTPIGGTLGTTKAAVVPWVHAGNTVSTYEAGVGFRALTASEVVTTFAAAAAGDNVLLGAADTLGGNLTVNSFGVQGTGPTVSLGGYTLTVTSGSIYGPNGTGQRLTLETGTIDFGSAEGFISGRNTIKPKISGTGGLSFIGGNGTRLYNTANDFTGDVTIATGVEIYGNNTIPVSNKVRLAEWGTLTLTTGYSDTIAGLAGTGKATTSTTSKLVIGTHETAANNTITLTTNGTLAPGNNNGASDLLPGLLTLNTSGGTGTVALNGGTLSLDLNSATLYDSVGLTGGLTFGGGGTTLSVALAFAPATGQGFLIVDNDGADAVTGKFANGDSVTATFGGSTFKFEILYNTSLFGGDGNDIALRVLPGGTLITVR